MSQEEDKKIRIVFEEVKENPSFKLAILVGYVDSYNSKYFQETIINHIRQGHRNIILNCKGLSYLSSAGIGSFVAISEELKTHGHLVLYSVHPKVLEVFTLLGFTKFFNICDTYEEAYQKAQMLLSKGNNPVSTEEKKVTFPFSFECKICGKRLKASKPGRYSCPMCQCSISIDTKGEIIYQ